jgi:hypothetical protein
MFCYVLWQYLLLAWLQSSTMPFSSRMVVERFILPAGKYHKGAIFETTSSGKVRK